jgi:hypothetical protein
MVQGRYLGTATLDSPRRSSPVNGKVRVEGGRKNFHYSHAESASAHVSVYTVLELFAKRKRHGHSSRHLSQQ